MKKLLSLFIWLPTTFVTLIFSLLYYSYYTNLKSNTISLENIVISQIPYNFYSSLPRVLGAKTTSEQANSEDVVPQLIKDYLAKYKSPMLGSADNLISIARKYQIDPLLLISIAQCESNLGKKMPHKTENIYECHNPFGWGIHQNGTLCFESWEEGYEAVSKGLKEKYYDKGYEDTEEIMVKYTPPALEKEGSWAKCVNYFLGKLDQEKSKY